MLRKLLKYEFKSTGRLILFIYAAVIVCAFIFGGVLRSAIRPMYSGHTMTVEDTLTIFTMIYGILLAAMMIVTLVMIIMRFYRNMLGPEGYLMHTLPVEKWKLVASKTITALVWVLFGIAVAAVSVLIIFGVAGAAGLRDGLFFSDGYTGSYTAGEILLDIFLGLVSITGTILCFYFSMAVGNMANRHKFALAVLVFLGITVIITVLQNTAVSFSTFELILRPVDTGVNDPEVSMEMNFMKIRELIFQIILSAVFFTGTTWILQKRLNLE